MAKFTVEMTPKKITKTISFMGLDFTEAWEPDGDFCWGSRTAIEEEVVSAFLNLDDEIAGIFEDFTVLDEGEMVEALETLTDYEKGTKL